jgi:uncharacterized membrane protein
MDLRSGPKAQVMGIPAADPAEPSRARPRVDSIDLLRGMVMVIMALDHTREYFTDGTLSPRDVHHPGLFLTRWITHFCASNFVFQAGVGAFLYASRGRTAKETSWFLFTRGCWLVLLEVTLVRIGWSFNPWPEVVLLQVIWVIGLSMVILSAGVFLPRPVLGGLALAIIAGHNVFDQVQPSAWGRFGWMWNLLHQRGFFQMAAHVQVLELYPLIPWVGVLAAGYAFGPVFLLSLQHRRWSLVCAGTTLLVLFLILRATGVYGDPTPWNTKDTSLDSVLSFVDCEKYPPSLLFLCMTLGPALIALAAFERARGALARFFITFGRVPLFYYLAHIYLIHSLAVGLALLEHRKVTWLFHGLPPMANPPGWDLSLPAVYGIWLLVILLLFWPCAWFADVKQRRRDWWLSYL